MIKTWSLTLMCVSALALLAGCAGNADNAPMASPSAMPTETAQPMTTDMPGVMQPSPTTMPAAEAAAISDSSEAMRVADAVEEELEKLSEVDEAEVLVFGNIALVGVEYDDQYQGGTTERIRSMVEDRIGTVHNGLENVYVTDDPLQVSAIETLKDALKAGGTAFADIQNQAQAIVDSLRLNNGAAGMPTSMPNATGIPGTAAPSDGTAT
ncbi:MAG: YhcN/YlaJ family sporulation lipoprotein [Clostridia bacterium]|nr:YhcN/YlaJ family sporulation lipoprotein [Clostridia bacterium]